MHSDAKVREVFELRSDGLIQRDIAGRTGVSLGQVRKWLCAGEEAVLAGPMRAEHITHDERGCSLVTQLQPDPYAYVLGQYLGDGCLVRMRRDVFKLAITTCDDYPQIRQECIDAVRAVMPGRSVGLAAKQGAHDVYCYSKHWPCLFPQHGPGRKHLRRIELEPWQREIALAQAPDLFVRGLIHSDGCRSINRVKLRGREYEYVRYFFSNRSRDIRMLFLDACGALGVEARHNGPFSVSVAKRYSVSVLEDIIGPKT